MGELGKSFRILKVRHVGSKAKTRACNRKGFNAFSLLQLVSGVYSNLICILFILFYFGARYGLVGILVFC
jgi:hypothetical protein